MNIFEKFKNNYLAETFTGHFSISKIIIDLDDFFDLETNEEQIIIDFINYLIKDDIFYIGTNLNSNGNCIPLQINNDLKKLKSLIELHERNPFLCFGLTEKGKNFALEYFEKNIKSCENIVLLFQDNEYIGFGDILQIADLQYKFRDFDEAKFEIDDIMIRLFWLDLLDIGLFENNTYRKWSSTSSRYSLASKVCSELEKFEEYPKNGDIGWFRLTDEGKRVLQEYQHHGGRIRDYWKKD